VPPGNYVTALGFPDASQFGTRGIIAVDSNFVTVFHLDNNAQPGFLDCSPCPAGSDNPDHVSLNGNFGISGVLFEIGDTAGSGFTDNVLLLTSSDHATLFTPSGEEFDGGWGAAKIMPLPTTGFLVVIGFIALGLLERVCSARE